MNDQSVDPIDAAKKDAVRVKRADGSWVKLPAQPLTDDPRRLTDDPVVAEVGKLGREEFRAILADRTHPDHAAAAVWQQLLIDHARRDLLTVDAANTPQLTPAALAAMDRFEATATTAVRRNQFLERRPPRLPANLKEVNQVKATLEQAAGSFSGIHRHIRDQVEPPKERVVVEEDDRASLRLRPTPHDRDKPPSIVDLILAGAVELPERPRPSAVERERANTRAQEEMNERLQQAIEIMGAFVEGQDQLLELERVKRDAAEEREKTAQAEAAAARKRERHQNVGMWIGIAVGVAGVAVGLLAL